MEKRKSLQKEKRFIFGPGKYLGLPLRYDGPAAAVVVDTHGPIHIRAVASSHSLCV